MTTPRFGLTLGKRGWYRRIDGRTRWVASLAKCPTPEQADEHFRLNFAALTSSVAERHDLSLEDVAKLWIADRLAQVDAGKLSARTVQGDRESLRMFLRVANRATCVGDDSPELYARVMESIRGLSTSRVANHVNAIRAWRRWAHEMGYAPAPTFGPAFRLPTARQRRIEATRREAEADYTAAEVRSMLDVATGDMRAWILLAVNCGLGNADIARLESRHVQADRLTMPRGKTGTPRTVPLWPETVAALPLRIGLLFTTCTGKPIETPNRHGVISERFRRFCAANGIAYHGFYGLRRTFATLASEAGEQWLVSEMMGHVTGGNAMTRRYVQRSQWPKMLAISEHVRAQIVTGGIRTRDARVAGV
jgi:integrase